MKFKFLILIAIFAFTKIGLTQNFVAPDVVTNLSEMVNETSGLANLDGEIWTHNDSGDDAQLYQIIPSNGNISRIVEITNATNEDWEDITHDENFIYIGDIGNNYGDRADLKVYKVSRAALEASDEVNAEIIHYSYSDQTSWEPNHNNNDFDCEALCSFGDHLYLFSKNWVDNQTRCYQLSKQAGFHVAEYQSTYDIDCLVTGGEILYSPNKLILIGYNSSGGSYSWIFENFSNDDFFSGDHTKLIWTSLTQIEGVCVANNNGIYISSEKYGGFLDPTLYYHDIENNNTVITEQPLQDFRIFSKDNMLIIEPNHNEIFTAEIQLLNISGTVVYKKQFENKLKIQLPVNVVKGIYIVVVTTEKSSNSYKISL